MPFARVVRTLLSLGLRMSILVRFNLRGPALDAVATPPLTLKPPRLELDGSLVLPYAALRVATRSEGRTAVAISARQAPEPLAGVQHEGHAARGDPAEV